MASLWNSDHAMCPSYSLVQEVRIWEIIALTSFITIHVTDPTPRTVALQEMSPHDQVEHQGTSDAE